MVGGSTHYDNLRLAKRPYLEQSETLFERKKYNQKPNPCLQAVILIGQIYTIPTYKKEIEKRISNFLWNRKKWNLPDSELKFPSGGTG